MKQETGTNQDQIGKGKMNIRRLQDKWHVERGYWSPRTDKGKEVINTWTTGKLDNNPMVFGRLESKTFASRNG